MSEGWEEICKMVVDNMTGDSMSSVCLYWWEWSFQRVKGQQNGKQPPTTHTIIAMTKLCYPEELEFEELEWYEELYFAI